MLTKIMRLGLAFVLLLGVRIAIGLLVPARTGPNARHPAWEGTHRLAALDHVANHLKNGMSRWEVEQLLGKPVNSDTNYVWFWTVAPGVVTNDFRWVDHYYGDDGRFLMFYHDKLISPLLKSTETTPWDYLMTTLHTNSAGVELILGPKPKIVWQQ